MIQRLDEHHYVRPIERIRLGSSFVHSARVAFGSDIATAYVKAYRPGTAELFNDALGYAMCAALDLPRPRHAAVLDLPVELLRNPALEPPQWLDEAAGTLPVWVTEWAPGNTLAQVFRLGEDEDALWRQVLVSKFGAAIASLDEWTCNADRNGGNLIRQSSRVWLPIDHGQCLSGASWPLIGILDLPARDLLQRARALLRLTRRKQFEGAMTVSAQAHLKAFEQALPTLQLLTELLPATPLRASFVPYLSERAQPNWMPDRVGLI